MEDALHEISANYRRVMERCDTSIFPPPNNLTTKNYTEKKHSSSSSNESTVSSLSGSNNFDITKNTTGHLIHSIGKDHARQHDSEVDDESDPCRFHHDIDMSEPDLTSNQTKNENKTYSHASANGDPDSIDITMTGNKQ